MEEHISYKIKKTHKQDILDKIKGCLFGGAGGDALGAPVEFLQDFLIFKKYGENGITELELCDTEKGKKALVTDDTQMTLFTAAGMIDALEKYAPPMSADYIKFIYENYMSWLTTQEDFMLSSEMSPSWLLKFEELRHRRGPGNTCLSALRLGYNGSIEYRINSSKGCGGVMRAAPIGFLTALKFPMNIKEIGLLGAESAAITHGHELGFTPAAFLAMAVAYILNGRTIYDAILLSKNTFFEIFPEKTDLRDRFTELVERALELARADEDIDDLDAIRELGGGWVAEETLAIAIYCSVRYSDNFEKALVAAVNHSGDSDSTGAVTGNILGAYIGYEKIPAKFKENIDVEEAIESIVSKFSNLC